jgi:translocation and assembly module TamB
LSGQDLSLRSAIDGINWHSGRLALAFDEQHVQINEFSTQSGKGKLGVTGQLRLGPETTGQLQLQADRFTLLGRVDRRVLVSGQGQVQIEPRLAKVAGQFTVDDGFFDISRLSAPSLPSDVVVVRGGAGASTPSESTTEKPAHAAATDPLCAVLGRPCDIQLAIKLGQRMRFQGRGLTAGLTGDLNISGTAARQPRIQGLILMTEDSTYRAYGQNLRIERGRIAVSGPLDAPRIDLDVEATRKLTEFGNANASGTETEVARVGIALTGPITNLRAKLFSEPDSLSEMEKLSWLLLGRGTDATATSKESALLQQAVVALLQGEGDGLSLSALGLDDLSVSKQGVRVGKQLTDRVYLGYERGLNTSADSVQLIYSIARQFSLSWQRRDDASNSLQLNWSWRWN